MRIRYKRRWTVGVILAGAFLYLGLSMAAIASACNTVSLVGVPACDTLTGVTTITWTAILGSSSDVPTWTAGIVQGASQQGQGGGNYAVSTTTTEPAAFASTVYESEQAHQGESIGNVIYAGVTLTGNCVLPPPPPPVCKPPSTIVHGVCTPPKPPVKCGKGTVLKHGVCVVPPKPKRHHVVVRPRAHFVGPCGEPMYRAVFRNTTAHRVRFDWRYVSYPTGTVRHVVRTLKAHRSFTTRYVHVLGSTYMRITDARGQVLAAKHSAAPGTYRACRA